MEPVTELHGAGAMENQTASCGTRGSGPVLSGIEYRVHSLYFALSGRVRSEGHLPYRDCSRRSIKHLAINNQKWYQYQKCITYGAWGTLRWVALKP